MERAQKDAEHAEKTDDSGSDSSDSDSSSSSKSSFGVKSSKSASPKAKRKAAPKPGAKKKGTPQNKTKKADESGQPSAEKVAPSVRFRKKGTPKASPVKDPQAEAEKNVKQHLDTAQKYLQSLLELKPDTIWRSCVRASEVDRRLSKEVSVTNVLENLLGSEGLPSETWQKVGTCLVWSYIFGLCGKDPSTDIAVCRVDSWSDLKDLCFFLGWNLIFILRTWCKRPGQL